MNNDCFALRFNLYKCGYLVPDDTGVFAKMYGEDKSFLDRCLENYEEINRKNAGEIMQEAEFEAHRNKTANKKILFLGDSITADRLSYGKILAKVLGGDVTDGAISSSRTIDLITVLDRLLAENKPDVVSVMIGTNDSTFSDKKFEHSFTSKEEYERNIGIIIERIKAVGADIILNAVPEADYEKFNKINPFWSVSKENNDIFNGILQRAAADNGLTFNDYREKMRLCDINLLFEPDALHLSPYSHRIIAAELLKEL